MYLGFHCILKFNNIILKSPVTAYLPYFLDCLVRAK